MKFTKIRLIGLATIDLPIVGALPSDRYILKTADGLGPTEVDVAITNTRNAGGVYQGRRPQLREPVLTVGLNPDHGSGQTASEMRNTIYGLLTPGPSDNVQIQFLDGDTIVATDSGYVKKIEPQPFTNEPQVQITISSLLPYLQATDVLYVAPGGTLASPEIENTGNAPTGFHMEVNLTAAMSSWVLTNARSEVMEFDYDFLSGDKLEFDTRPGQRGIWVTRDLVRSPVIYSLSSASKWFMLYGGNNVFSTSSQAFTWGDVYFLPQYWGI